MKKLKNNQLNKIYGGGGISLGVGIAIVAGVTFIIGVIDG